MVVIYLFTDVPFCSPQSSAVLILNWHFLSFLLHYKSNDDN